MTLAAEVHAIGVGLWPQVTAAYKGYGSYQTKTDREIPLVLLEPADGTPG